MEIDSIKGLALLMVIALHSMMPYSLYIGSILHVEQAVPFFLMVSAYLAFSKYGMRGIHKPYIAKSCFLLYSS